MARRCGYCHSSCRVHKVHNAPPASHSCNRAPFPSPHEDANHIILLQSDLAYAICQFSFGSHKVRTHIHLSTCFTGWFLPSGSTVHEELVPTLDPDFPYEYHANTCQPPTRARYTSDLFDPRPARQDISRGYRERHWPATGRLPPVQDTMAYPPPLHRRPRRRIPAPRLGCGAHLRTSRRVPALSRSLCTVPRLRRHRRARRRRVAAPARRSARQYVRPAPSPRPR